jgi:DNA-binding MarR family transcriptional regulator
VNDQLPIEERTVAALRQIMRAVDLHSRHLMDECGLTGPQLAALREASRLGPVSSGALARAVHLSQPTVTGILNRLEKRGLILRSRGESDRRTVTVALTDLGREVLSRAPSLLQDRLRAELSRLEEWEQSMTLATLQRVAAMMGAEDLEAAPHLVSTSPELNEASAPAAKDADLESTPAPRKTTPVRHRRGGPRPRGRQPPRLETP